MTLLSPRIVEEHSVSAAWARAFLLTYDTPERQLAPVVVSVLGGSDSLPVANDPLRLKLDALLALHDRPTTEQTALTIFPYRIWIRRGRPNPEVFRTLCVERLFPRMKARHPSRNGHGTYFQRLMSYPDANTGTNTANPQPIHQLEHVIALLSLQRTYKYRESALQLAIFHPKLDHSRQRQRGFPCLQQIGIAHGSKGSFGINAFYPTQQMFDRAYGNYLGLCHLGLFIAHHTSLRFDRLNCYIGCPMRGRPPKQDLRDLAKASRALLSRLSEDKELE